MKVHYNLELIAKKNYYSRKGEGDQGWPIPLDPLNTNALNLFTSHCKPEGRGNLVAPVIASSSRQAGLLAMTGCLMRLY